MIRARCMCADNVNPYPLQRLDMSYTELVGELPLALLSLPILEVRVSQAES